MSPYTKSIFAAIKNNRNDQVLLIFKMTPEQIQQLLVRFCIRTDSAALSVAAASQRAEHLIRRCRCSAQKIVNNVMIAFQDDKTFFEPFLGPLKNWKIMIVFNVVVGRQLLQEKLQPWSKPSGKFAGVLPPFTQVGYPARERRTDFAEHVVPL